jgi:hypothetical protein
MTRAEKIEIAAKLVIEAWERYDKRYERPSWPLADQLEALRETLNEPDDA